ncbi:MAG TPA: hypothetical protein ENN63_05125 [Bacteroidetes bacterium]|nr:hypothetical protein [Bacteroidota bacterium]
MKNHFSIKHRFILFLVITVFLGSCTEFFADIDLQDDWVVYTSDNIVLHTRPTDYPVTLSPTPEQAEGILANQQFYYRIIQDSIEKSFSDRVLIYLYNLEEAKELIGTDGGGHAIPKMNGFYYTFIPALAGYTDQYGVVNPFLGAHELVHVITHRILGYPGTKLMSEGYANWLDGGYARHDIEDIVVYYRDHEPDKVLTPDDLLEESISDEDIFYPNSGILIRYLVHRYGVGVVNTLFPLPPETLKNRFENLTGCTWEDMSSHYADYIDDLQESASLSPSP